VFSYILRRLAMSIPTLVVASFFVFVLVAASGDPLAELRANPGISDATINAREQELNLDEPLLSQYRVWATNAVQGDLGESVQFNEPVSEVLARRLGVTFRLVFLATIIGVVVAVFIGVVAAVKQYSLFDHGSTFLAFVFFSMPVFWLAAVLKDAGIRMNDRFGQTIFYTVGERTPNLDAGFIGQLTDRAGHLLLPSLTLILISVAGWSRYQRASMRDVLHTDYVRTARAKGLSESQVLGRHALRNALVPVVTVVALDFGAILGGAIVTERVFAWKGMGTLLIESLQNQDTPMVQGWLLASAVIVIMFNFAADIFYGYLDPRIRRA